MLKLLYFSIQDNFDLRIKRTRYLIILADTYVFLAKAQRRYVFKLNAGAIAKEQRRNELGDTIVNAEKELTSIPLNSFGTVVEYLICSSFPGSRIKSGMTKMVSPSFPLPDLVEDKLRGNGILKILFSLHCHSGRSEAQTRNPGVLLQSWTSNNI